MRAITIEVDREPSMLRCRTVEEIAPWLTESPPDRERVFAYLFDRMLVTGIQRDDGFALLPSPAGIDWLSLQEPVSDSIDDRTDEHWYDNRIIRWVAGTITTLLAAYLAHVLGW